MENDKNIKVETIEIKEPESYKEVADALEKENKLIKKKYDELTKKYNELSKMFETQCNLTRLANETIISVNNTIKNYDTTLNIISGFKKGE